MRLLELLGLAAVVRLVIGSGGRLSLWWDVPSGASVDQVDRYLDQLERAHIRELSIVVQDHSPRSWHLGWSLPRLERFVTAARKRGIRCGVMIWPHPDPAWIDSLVSYGPQLVRAGAQFVELDVEENWRAGRVQGYRSLAEAAVDLVESARTLAVPLEATTYPYGVEPAADVIRQVDAFAVQAYSQADADERGRESYAWGRSLGPGGMQELAARKAREAGARSLVMGLAAYDQVAPWDPPPGVDVTPHLAMRAAYEAALKHTKRVRWWSAKWVVGYPGRNPTSYALPFLESL